jgi:hypothetical protein
MRKVLHGYSFTIIALLAFYINPYFAKAQVITKEASVKITGEVTSPLDLKLSDFQNLNIQK